MVLLPRMRRRYLSATVLLLITGLLLLWRHRFERVPDAPVLGLSDLRSAAPVLPPGAVWSGSLEHPVLRLTVSPEHPRVAVRMELPGIPTVEALHLRFNMTARNLKLGKQEWDDGRSLIEWHTPDGVSKQETDPVCSLRDNETSGDISLVVRPMSGSSVPVLRVEHLGHGGEYVISKLEIIPVKERPLWIFGRWGLLVVWLIGMTGLLSGVGNRSIWRRAVAAGIWIGIGVYFAVPGPWKTLRPLVIPFEMGTPMSAMTMEREPMSEQKITHTASSVPPSIKSVETLGKIPLQGGWIIQAKHDLANARPLMHALLLFVPTLAFTWLVGRKAAIRLALVLAVSIEAAQVAFGYGFDWVDVGDLASDAVGIALAIWVYGKMLRRLRSKGG